MMKNKQEDSRYKISRADYGKVLRLGFVERDNDEVSPIEAIFLSQIGIINVPKEIMENVEKSDDYLKEKLGIMKKLLKKGYITRVKTGDTYLRLYRKGMRVGEDRTRWIVKIVKSEDEINGILIHEMINRAKKLRKSGIICIANDNEITFISVSKRTFE